MPLPFRQKRDMIILVSMPACRNGRRGRLKICCGQPRVGSSPTVGIKSLDFTGFARLSLQKVIKKVIKYLSEGILIEKLNKIKGGNLVHMMLKRNSIRFEFNWYDNIKR